MRPAVVMQLAAETQGRVVAIDVHEGDIVTKGEPLIQLDTQELEMDLRRVENEYLQAISEADLANSKVDEAQMQGARLRARKAAAQMERVQYEIDRASLRAPFNGVIIGPKNLGQKLGMVVQVGEPMVEVASTGDWEVKLDFSEQDLAMLENLLAERGRIEGGLKLTAEPAHKYSIEITNSEQLAYGLEIKDNEYQFIAVVPFPKDAVVGQTVRAGFSGRAAFYVGMRPLGYIWFHDWVRAFRVNWL
ncbi:MAG: hypothetical protein B7X06_02455 [Verrucomicrobia bacterium 21-51-4]|nr:MAG: hypothetical protein B7X06_02455 [Verrucomicrobia bacterium 21-51-4]